MPTALNYEPSAPMPVPETTSAEGIDRFAVGKRIIFSKGPAWEDIRISVFALPPVSDAFTMPAVSEPFIAWICSGEADAQEREGNGPWITSRLKKGSMRWSPSVGQRIG